MRWHSNLIRFSAVLFTSAIFASTALATTPTQCELSSLGKLDLSRPDKAFTAAFCGTAPAGACTRKLNNLHDLIRRLSQDSRIPNVATAAYVIATVYVETGSGDYNPGTVESIGPAQKKRIYYPNYIGRGWVQLTYQDKYHRASRELHDFLVAHKLPTDLTTNTETVRVPDVSYEILVRAMLEGWLEQYRTSPSGGGGKEPIRLGDFVTSTSINYGQARGVINGNWIGPKPARDEEMGPGRYLPDEAHLDAGVVAAKKAVAAEGYICRIQEK